MIDEFLAYIRVEKRFSPLTVKSYERDIRQFARYIESINGDGFDPAAISPEDIRMWIVNELQPAKLKPSSINKMLSSVRAFFRWLRKEGHITKDPFLRTGFLKTPSRLPVNISEKRMERVITELEEEYAGGDFITKRNSLIILLLYATGIRLAELIAIQRHDISADMREIRVHGKGDKDRIVPLLSSVAAKISDYLEEIKRQNICTSNEYSLFLTEKGERISRIEVYRVVREELTRAGVQGKRSPHVLRHTFATHLLNSGADMREIQELLGHTSLSTTQIYTHNSITKLKEVYKEAHPRAHNNKQPK